jgi:hypothetical protein
MPRNGTYREGPSVDAVNAALRDRVVELVMHIRGERPSKRGRRYVRFGRQGSLRVDVSGPEQGRIIDFEGGSGKGRSPFDYIIEQCKLTGFAEAMRWAINWLGWSEKLAPNQPKPREHENDAEAEAARKTAYARRLWDTTKPLKGSLAEKDTCSKRAASPRQKAAFPRPSRFTPPTGAWRGRASPRLTRR